MGNLTFSFQHYLDLDLDSDLDKCTTGVNLIRTPSPRLYDQAIPLLRIHTLCLLIFDVPRLLSFESSRQGENNDIKNDDFRQW